MVMISVLVFVNIKVIFMLNLNIVIVSMLQTKDNSKGLELVPSYYKTMIPNYDYKCTCIRSFTFSHFLIPTTTQASSYYQNTIF